MKNAKENPDTLFIIIFDEAHHSATAKNEDKKPTPYQKLAKPWNSEDFPNVFVLMVSATPWNLQTVNTKIKKTEASIDPNNDYMINPYARSGGRNNFILNEVHWSDSHEGDLIAGKKCRLVVSLRFHSYTIRVLYLVPYF